MSPARPPAPPLRNGASPGSVREMRVIATGMLLAMAAVFAAASRLDDVHPAWGFVRAFAEAAMVGGLADWFAVTALFRHPLGLPIPHTAIIPRNKDRIGDTLAAFLRDNFLTPSVVARRMRGLDVAGAAGRFLANPPGGGRLREEPADGAGHIDLAHPPRHDAGRQEIVTEEGGERVADPVLVARDDRRVRDRQAERVAEQRGNGEPVGNAADHRRFGKGAHEAPGGVLVRQAGHRDEDGGHAGEHRGCQHAHAARAPLRRVEPPERRRSEQAHDR